VCARRARRPGILTADETLAKRYLELGALFVAVGIDVNLLTKNARALAQRFKAPESPASR
jgi:4-hydroxy-2-oxoheptanedioate aldolase